MNGRAPRGGRRRLRECRGRRSAARRVGTRRSGRWATAAPPPTLSKQPVPALCKANLQRVAFDISWCMSAGRRGWVSKAGRRLAPQGGQNVMETVYARVGRAAQASAPGWTARLSARPRHAVQGSRTQHRCVRSAPAAGGAQRMAARASRMRQRVSAWQRMALQAQRSSALGRLTPHQACRCPHPRPPPRPPPSPHRPSGLGGGRGGRGKGKGQIA